jgi:hypothetical protein
MDPDPAHEEMESITRRYATEILEKVELEVEIHVRDGEPALLAPR